MLRDLPDTESRTSPGHAPRLITATDFLPRPLPCGNLVPVCHVLCVRKVYALEIVLFPKHSNWLFEGEIPSGYGICF